jgi:hypothetical protein
MMKKAKVSLVFLGLLVLTSFIPVFQVLIMYLNGALLAVVSSLFANEGYNIVFVVNGIMTILFLISFYLSNKKAVDISTAVGVMIFFLPLLSYATENVFSEEKYYFLQFLVIGAIVGTVLLLMEVYKIKTKNL